MKNLIGKKVFIKYDINLMLPYTCEVIEVDEKAKLIRVKEFNKCSFNFDAILCQTDEQYSNMLLFMKKQLDSMVERHKKAEKELKDEILKYIELVNCLN